MATDATGTPTSLGIPKYDPANDAPSGLGFNAAMDAIDALIAANPNKPSGIASGEAVVWNGTGWARSSVTRINTIRPQDLAQDGASSGQVLTWNGSIWAPAAVSGGVSVIDRETSTTDVASTAAETTVFTHSVSAGSMGTDKMLRLLLIGDLLHNNGAGDTITLRVKFGGTTHIATGGLNVDGTTGTTRVPWSVEVRVANLGAANSQFIHMHNMMNRVLSDAGTGIGTTNSDHREGEYAITTLGTIDTASAQTLEVTAQWSASSANNSFRRRYALLELV